VVSTPDGARGPGGTSTGETSTGETETGGEGMAAAANPGLAAALARALRGAGRDGVYAALLAGRVLVPATRAAGGPSGSPALLRLAGSDSEVLLGFSSRQAIEVWSGEFASYVVLPGRDLAKVARASRAAAVVLDAGGAGELTLVPGELDQLADGRMPAQPGNPAPSLAHASRRVRPTQAAWPPEAVAAIEQVGTRPEVSASYLFDVAYDDGDPMPAVGLRFSGDGPATVGEIMTELSQRLAALLPRGATADLIAVDDDLLAGLHGRVAPLTGGR
jgi:type III secretion system (T3SS) SseB-like protein